MSELYDKIVSERGSFEKMVASIPGFKGYQDKQAQRKADTMLREFAAGKIQQLVDKLVQTEKLILDNIGMSYMSRTRDLKGRIQLYHDKVSTAAPKYSGMWAQMKIGPDELEKIYSFDEAQIRYIEALDLTLDELKQAALSQEGLDQAIMNANSAVNEAIDAFALRDDVLTGFSESL